MQTKNSKPIDQDFLNKMRIAAKLAVSTLEMIEAHIKSGVTSNELNDLCHSHIIQSGAIPAPLGYQSFGAPSPFPKSICTSTNHVVCHGIPDDKPLKNGDIINIDVSLSKNGAFADTCKMFFIGTPSDMASRLVQCAKECLYSAIAKVAPGVSIRKIGATIEHHAEKHGYSIVKEFCGHGIGTVLHSDPQIIHYDDPLYENDILQPGMTFTIEPMINVGKPDVRILSDGWTVITEDHSLSAQFEHTILVTDNGFEILTLRGEESLEEITKFK